MNTERIEVFQGRKIELLEMILSNVDNQLTMSWKIVYKDAIYRITFYNISRMSIDNFSIPLEVQGFEIIDHSQEGWETNSKYEIHDYEDGRVNFFCEHFEIGDKTE